MKFEVKSMKINHLKQQQSGMVIVLAILIIAAVLGTAILFSNLIIRDIRQSRLIDQSIQAYYNAESGSERALYQIRKNEAIIDCSALAAGASCDESTARCTTPFDAIPCVTETAASPFNAWTVSVGKEATTTITLNEGETFQVDLFDPSQTAASGIDRIELHFDSDTILYGSLTNLTKILGITGNSCSGELPELKNFISASPVILTSFTDGQISSDCSYIFKLNYPLTDPSNNLAESTRVDINVYYNDSGSLIALPIPSRLIIGSSATFGDSGQVVKVRTPMRPPLSGLYDFVLFSGKDIIKENL